jgi:hypothetical protein
MKKLFICISAAAMTFVGGVALPKILHRRTPPAKAVVVVQSVEKEIEWPLTAQIVSRSLQTHSFRTTNLRRNSNDEIVWRWLKTAIAAYPQDWVKLQITDNESYGVILNPPMVLTQLELSHNNNELKQKGLPLLEAGKPYLPVDVYSGKLICPSWHGIIDVEQAKLMYFKGISG